MSTYVTGTGYRAGFDPMRVLRLQATDLSDVRLARILARRAVAPWCRRETADDVVLVVSELVTHGLAHGGGACRLDVRAEPSRIHIEVADFVSFTTSAPDAAKGSGLPGHPVLVSVIDPREPVGLWRDGGMHVISRLARQWGIRPGQPPFARTVFVEIVT